MLHGGALRHGGSGGSNHGRVSPARASEPVLPGSSLARIVSRPLLQTRLRRTTMQLAIISWLNTVASTYSLNVSLTVQFSVLRLFRGVVPRSGASCDAAPPTRARKASARTAVETVWASLGRSANECPDSSLNLAATADLPAGYNSALHLRCLGRALDQSVAFGRASQLM